MEAAAADLLAAISSPSSHAGLHSRCAAYLQPFAPYLRAANPNPKPPPKRATKQSKPPPPPDAATLRPLAKRFLPFIARGLQLLPPLIRASPASGDAGGGGPGELLEIYGLLLDCLEVISPCLEGKPYSVLLQRGRFVCSLESRGHLARANVEATAALDALRSLLSPPTTSTKSRRGAASVATVLLPDPGSAGDAGRDPEVTTLAVELTVCLANCASKGKVMEAAPYERLLILVEQLQPWLRILSDDVSRKYLPPLVNAMSRCLLFLVAESAFFSTELVHEFCVSTIEEYVKAQMIECLPAVDLPKAVNEFLVFVAYFSRCILSSNKDLCVGASELLYKQVGYFSEVSSSTATVLLLYAAGLYFNQQEESEMRPGLPVDILNDQKYLQALDRAGGSLALMSDDSVSLVTYVDALEFVCEVLLQHTNAVWKNFSDGEAIHYSGDMDRVLRTLHQFIDSSLVAYSSAKMSEEDNERLLQQHGTLLRVLVSTLKMEFVTNKDIKKTLDSIKCAISSKWLTLGEFKFLTSSLGNIGVTLYNTGHVKQAPEALELCCQTIWAHVKLFHSRLLSRTEANGTMENLPKDTLKDTILDAFTRIAKMVDTLRKCGSEMTRDIVAQSLTYLLAHGHMSEYSDSSLILIKLWVKATRKDFEANQVVDSAPLLYQYLLRCSCPLPKKLIGLLVKQELLAYGSVEPQCSKFCAEMQIRIIDVLLDKIYYSKEYYLERSEFLVRKSGALRACGSQNIKSCLESLSEAMYLLRTISEDSSQSSTTVINQLAIAQCLHAHCDLECNPVSEVILENVSGALRSWSKFGFDATEVNKTAVSLVSEASGNDQSNFVAGYLYYDLSERLFSYGQLFQALSYGKEALHLRKKLLTKKFKLNLGSSGSKESQCVGYDLSSLEAWGPRIAEIWPDSSKSNSTRDSFLTSWSVLRCYLESTLQVAMMHELIGNGTEAEILLRTGKEISNYHGLSIFRIAFTSLLGQLCSRRQLWDEAKSELKNARDLLVEHDAIISSRAMGSRKGYYGDHEVHSVYWQCISLLFFRSFPQDCYRIYEPHLVGLIVGGSTGDFLPFEHAEILCSMSFILLKSSLSEQSRNVCCSFSSVGISDVVPWLLKAFVLSRECPSLFQEGTLADFRSEAHEDVSEFLRFPSMIMSHIEKHINEFFEKLPDVPVVCISMIGGDYVDVVEGFLLLPSSFPAWMLLSRFDSTEEPTTMLLPVAAISEKQSADSSIKDLDRMRVLDKKWQCPWGYAITDYVAPTFKNILEENYISLSSAVNSVRADNVRWWSHRMKLNKNLDSLLKGMEKSWFGPWKCLLLGHQLSDQNIEAALLSIITGLDAKKVVFNPVLIKAILGGALSVDEVQECVDQLILYKGYFGRGGCCGKDRLRALSSSEVKDEDLETVKCLITNAVYELPEPVDKSPVILVLDINVQGMAGTWDELKAKELVLALTNHDLFLYLGHGSDILIKRWTIATMAGGINMISLI
nr:unnamed protein product [Digitaria exilis]